MFAKVADMSEHDQPFNSFANSVHAQDATVRISRVPESDAAVVLRFEPAVRRFCRSRTRSPEDADDAVQDTFMRFLRRSEQKIRNNEAWLITAAWRACADINRRHRRDEQRFVTSAVWDGCFTQSEADSLVDVRAPNPEQQTVDHLVVGALLRRLSSRERTVVMHLYFMGANSTELSRYLGVTPEHLRVIAMRARRHARAILADMDRPAT
jgi:RNA polymerase sigma-70 factor (ECF subfamily)